MGEGSPSHTEMPFLIAQIYTQKKAGVALRSDWFLGRICSWKIHMGLQSSRSFQENRSSIDQADPAPLLLLPLVSDDLTKISFGAALAEGGIN